MPAWTVQWYGNEPAVENVCTKIWPDGRLLLKDVPSLEVTVCEKVPLFCQHTDCPCVMVAVLGENTLASVALTLAAAIRRRGLKARRAPPTVAPFATRLLPRGRVWQEPGTDGRIACPGCATASHAGYIVCTQRVSSFGS